MTLGARSAPAPNTSTFPPPATLLPAPSHPGAPPPEAPTGFSPPPQLWAPAERSSQPPPRAPADPPADHHAPTLPAPPPANGDPDAGYRDLLLRLREEREQLGHLISHPF